MKIVFILTSLLVSNLVLADDEISASIKTNVLDNLHYFQAEDIEKSMSTMHSQSPSFLPTKNVMVQLFDNYKLSYELLAFKYIGYDGDLAYVRVKQRTKKISGPAFKDNEVDMVQLFRQENGVWKLWAQATVEVVFIQ